MIQESEETGASAAVESGHAPSPSRLLGLMADFREQIGIQLSKDVEEGRHPRSYEDTNDNMLTIIDILLDQNQQLVSCLAELENEVEKRTVQMQKRLHSTADVTRETVYKMCEWGEKIQNMVSKRRLAEQAAYESKRMVEELQKENNQLRNYSDNLHSDIQSLLSIINVARTTGNWEMDCVTFCVISPEEVYGPICRLSSQHADGVTTLDVKPDSLLQGPATQETRAINGAPSMVGGESTSCRTKFSTDTPDVYTEAEVTLSRSLPLMCSTMQDDMKDCAITRLRRTLLIQQRSRSFECPILLASWKRRARKMRRSHTPNMSKWKLSAPVLNSHFGRNMATVATTASCDRLYRPAEYDGIRTEASDTSAEVMKTHTDQSEHILDKTFILSAVQEGPLKTDKRSLPIMTTTKPVAEWEERQSNLSESLPALSSVWEESVVIQRSPKSVESFLLSWRKKSKNVRRRLNFYPSKQLYVSKQSSRNKHSMATTTMVNRKDVEGKNYSEVSTQTQAFDKTFGDKSTQTDLPRTFKKHDESKRSTAIMGTQTDVECEVEFREKVLNNLENKLTTSRKEADDLKEELLHVKSELELAKKVAAKERAENMLSKAELEKMSMTMKHLQDALVELKKNKVAGSATLPRVHDV